MKGAAIALNGPRSSQDESVEDSALLLENSNSRETTAETPKPRKRPPPLQR